MIGKRPFLSAMVAHAIEYGSSADVNRRLIQRFIAGEAMGGKTPRLQKAPGINPRMTLFSELDRAVIG